MKLNENGWEIEAHFSHAKIDGRQQRTGFHVEATRGAEIMKFRFGLPEATYTYLLDGDEWPTVYGDDKVTCAFEETLKLSVDRLRDQTEAEENAEAEAKTEVNPWRAIVIDHLAYLTRQIDLLTKMISGSRKDTISDMHTSRVDELKRARTHLINTLKSNKMR